MDNLVPNGTNLARPRYEPSIPPKNYRKNKAISIFCCLYFSYGFKCPEILRARINKEGDIYVIPLIESLHYMSKPKGQFQDFHLSYHSSGEFHWTKDKTHIQPLFGEADFRKALELWLKFKSPPCLCFRKGKGLREGEIVSLIQHLASYLPLNIDVGEVAQNLKGSNSYRLVRKDLRKVS
jgi:hypothetical protein